MITITGYLPDPDFGKSLLAAFDELLADKSSYNYVVNVREASEEEIKRLNKQYRQVDEATDVLSFPLFESTPELPSFEAPIGDLVICPEKTGGSHLALNECYIHGILHLLGYDHERNKKEWDEARTKVRSNN